MLNLKRLWRDYEYNARSFSEINPWMIMVSPGLVLNKDGSLLACYSYSGVDMEGLTVQDTDHYAALVEHAMRVFDERITFWWTADRRRTDEYPEGDFEDAVATMINAIRAEEFASGSHYRNSYYMSVLFTPPTGTSRFMDRVDHFSRVEGMGFIRAIGKALRASFQKSFAFAQISAELDVFTAQFEDLLASYTGTISEVKPRRLEEEDLLAFLHDRCCPASIGQPVKKPRIPAYLDAYLADNTLHVGAGHLKFQHEDTTYATAVSVKDWPDLTWPGLIDILMTTPGELTLSQVFRYVNQDAARKYINDIQRHNLNKRQSFLSYAMEKLTNEPARKIDEGRQLAADDAGAAIAEMTTHGRVYGYYNMSAICYGRTLEEVEDTTTAITQIMRKSGFLVIREKLHMLSAWAGTLPGQWAELVRWYFVSSANLADLSPVRTLSVGQTWNPYLSEQMGRHCPALTVLSTNYSTPFYFNFHTGDMAHAIVIGPSRSGKSVFNNFLLSQYRKYHPVNIFIFDKDFSCKIPTLLQNGQHVDLTEESTQVKLNPMQLLADRQSWQWLAKWLEILLTSRGHQMTAEDDQLVWRAIENVAALPKNRWRLLTLVPFLGKTLAEQLQMWVGDGQMAKYFDNEEDSFTLSSFTCVEMGGLFLNQRVASAFMEYAFYRINRMLDGRPTLIYIEEAWFMLGDEYFCARINDWLRTLQKRNTFLVMATQSLDEIATSDIFATIIDNIPNKIFLPNPNANAHYEMYKSKFALNDEQITSIRHAIRKQQYLVVTPLVSRMVNAHFEPRALACLRSDTRAQIVFKKHYREDARGDDWKWRYIEEMVREDTA